MAFWDTSATVVARPPFPQEALLGLDSQHDVPLSGDQGTAAPPQQQRRVGSVESWSSVAQQIAGRQSAKESCEVADPSKGCSPLLTAADQQRLLRELNFDKPVSEPPSPWATVGESAGGIAPLCSVEPQLFPSVAECTVGQVAHMGTQPLPVMMNQTEALASASLTSALTSTTKPLIHAPPDSLQLNQPGGWFSEPEGCAKDLVARQMSKASDVQGQGCVGMVLSSLDEVDAMWQCSKPLFAGTSQNAAIDDQPGTHDFKAGLAGNEPVGFSADTHVDQQPVQMWTQGATSNSSSMGGLAIKPSNGSVLLNGNEHHHSMPGLQQDTRIFPPATCMPQEMPMTSMNEHGSDFLTTWKVGSDKPNCDLLAATSAAENIRLVGSAQMSAQHVCGDANIHSSQAGPINSLNLVSSTCDLLGPKGDYQLLQMNMNSDDKLNTANFANNSFLMRNQEIMPVQAPAVLPTRAPCAPLVNLSCAAANGGCVDQRIGGDLAAAASGTWTNCPAEILKLCDEDHSKLSSDTFCELKSSNSSSPRSTEGNTKSQESEGCRLGVGLKQKSSKYIGVSKHRRSGRWEAHIWINDYGRQVYLGGYDRPEDAACAYDVVAIKSKGLKASTNFNINRYLVLAEWLSKQTLPEVVTNVRRISRGFSRGTSKFRGVTLHPSGRWESRIGIHGNRHIYLGLYDDQEEAARHYDRALVRLKGLKAVTNFGLNCYGNEVEEHNWMQQNGKNGVNQSGPGYERWIKLGGMKVPQHC